jgi:hypothetical protein
VIWRVCTSSMASSGSITVTASFWQRHWPRL